jgi:hypothetical protein
VHGVSIHPADGRVYLATHDGLFRYDASGPRRIGPVIDLMGFAAIGPRRVPAPRATRGRAPTCQNRSASGVHERWWTWTPLSRQGQSDFHALTATGATVVGFDGMLRGTEDGRTWTTLRPPVEPFALSGSPDGRTLVATSQLGPVRSTDRGKTWARLDGTPLLQYVAFADARTVVGVSPDGAVAVSADRGRTWASRGAVGGRPQALGAHVAHDGALRVLVVTDNAVLGSTDGVSFTPL